MPDWRAVPQFIEKLAGTAMDLNGNVRSVLQSHLMAGIASIARLDALADYFRPHF